MKPDGTFWLQALVAKGPKLNPNDLTQQAAMPLAGFLRFDPWTDQVIQMHTTYEPLLSSRDKMPFEISPVYLKLTYWKAPELPPAAPASAAPTDGTAPPPGDTGAAPTTGSSNPGNPTDTVPPQPAPSSPPRN